MSEANSGAEGSAPAPAGPVLIYSTPGCGRCKAAQEFFQARGLAVEMLDVANDLGALRRMAKKAKGNRSVPVIEYGQEVVVGFDPAYWLERLGRQA